MTDPFTQPICILDDPCHRLHPSVEFTYPPEPSELIAPPDALVLLESLQRLCKWICSDGRSKPSGLMIRAAVLCWTVLPNSFQCASQVELTAMLGLKDKQSVGREVTSFARCFGYLDQRHNRRR